MTEVQLPGGLGQTGLADQIGAELAQIALVKLGKGGQQIVRRGEAQDGVAQEFQTLIAVQAVLADLVGVGGVGQGLLQQVRVLEVVADGVLQLSHFSSPSEA